MLRGRIFLVTTSRQRRHHRGVSLIEVLIAIVIASIGLLALAGVNTAAIRYTKMSQYRGTATLLANDLGERMRANKAGAGAYVINSNFATQAALPVHRLAFAVLMEGRHALRLKWRQLICTLGRCECETSCPAGQFT